MEIISEVCCAYCGVILKNKKLTFCSVNCANKSRKVEYIRECKYCGKNFIVNNIAEINRGGAIYCGHSCGSLANRKYSLNYNYFNNIDSRNKAYWLGFLFADGHNSLDEISIELQNKDDELLYEFKKEINSDAVVTTRTRNMFNKEITSSIFRISSRVMCYDLFKLGMLKNKTNDLEYPNISEEYHYDFIRGYFDGDGCIYTYNVGSNLRGRFSIFSNSNSFINKLFEVLKVLNIESIKFDNIITVSSKNNLCLLYDKLYHDNPICLKRKRDKFKELVNAIRSERVL